MAMKPSSKFSKMVADKPKPKPTPYRIPMSEAAKNPPPGMKNPQGFIVGEPDPMTQKTNQTITDARRAALLKGIKRK
jgi:hypothetical protein